MYVLFECGFDTVAKAPEVQNTIYCLKANHCYLLGHNIWYRWSCHGFQTDFKDLIVVSNKKAICVISVLDVCVFFFNIFFLQTAAPYSLIPLSLLVEESPLSTLVDYCLYLRSLGCQNVWVVDCISSFVFFIDLTFLDLGPYLFLKWPNRINQLFSSTIRCREDSHIWLGICANVWHSWLCWYLRPIRNIAVQASSILTLVYFEIPSFRKAH